jgi:Mg2+/citrate symporter
MKFSPLIDKLYLNSSNLLLTCLQARTLDNLVPYTTDVTRLAAGETIIAAEVFYAFEPLFSIGLTPLP